MTYDGDLLFRVLSENPNDHACMRYSMIVLRNRETVSHMSQQCGVTCQVTNIDVSLMENLWRTKPGNLKNDRSSCSVNSLESHRTKVATLTYKFWLRYPSVTTRADNSISGVGR